MHPGYITISEASRILKVHPNTLRNWEKKYILVPFRDKKSHYRYYSKSQLETFTRLRKTRRVHFAKGFEEVDAERMEELENAKHSFTSCMTTPFFPIFDPTRNKQYLDLFKKMHEKGVAIRMLANQKYPQTRRFGKNVAQFITEVRLKNIDGFSFNIVDDTVVSMYLYFNRSEKWMRIVIKKKSVVEQFRLLFETYWENALPLFSRQERDLRKNSSLPTSTILSP
jgi:DNA-binding transcriptional MerR regulator